MAGTPEEDLLAWLEREEMELKPGQTPGERYREVQEALTDFEKAQDLLFSELGYDITDEQFEALRGSSTLRYEELPSIGVYFGLRETAAGYIPWYKDIITGYFVGEADVFNLLATIR